MMDTNAPVVPEEVLTYLHAYGDSRADDDGSSGVRLAECITAMRRWASALSAPPTAEPAAEPVAWLRDQRGDFDEDGRYGVAPEGQADFTDGDPKWHRVVPVDVVVAQAAEAPSSLTDEQFERAWRVILDQTQAGSLTEWRHYTNDYGGWWWFLNSVLRAALASPSPDAAREVPESLKILLDEEAAELLRDTIGREDASPITLAIGDGHTGNGLYVWLTEYPEEGAICLLNIAAARQQAKGE